MSSSKKQPTTVYTVDIVSLANSGDGVGRIIDKVIFVPYTMPGDTVRVQITKDKKNFALGKLLKILTPSDLRVPAPCPYFGKCGGCDWQHLPYENQLQWKRRHLEETLKKIGGLTDLSIEKILPSPSSTHYRNRIQGQIKSGSFSFHKKGSSDLVPIESCLIADPKINEFLKTQLSSVPPGKVELAIDGKDVSVRPVHSNRTTELGFRQVNNAMSDLLTQKIMTLVGSGDYRSIYDLYCGRGHWTLKMAQVKPTASVIGVDALEENIIWARSYLQEQPLENLEYVLGKVEDQLGRLDLQNSLCIVDPPRAGLDPTVVKALCDNPSRDLIYISCHPATLARDLKVLTALSYSIIDILPLDMFPQTSHLESWVLLRGNPL